MRWKIKRIRVIDNLALLLLIDRFSSTDIESVSVLVLIISQIYL